MEASVKLRGQKLVAVVIMACILVACGHNERNEIQRPIDPWAVRSVLDYQPRMLIVALDSNLYVAYDLAHCTLYKAWKGGVLWQGTDYTDQKNVQPLSWGTAYSTDSMQQFQWVAQSNGKNDLSRVVNKGYIFRNNQIYLQYAIILSSGDTVHIEERPEFVRGEAGKPGLERLFKTSGVPEETTISLKARDTSLTLHGNETTRWTLYFDALPAQTPPDPQAGFDSRGRYFMQKSDCFTCHQLDHQTVGPSFRQIAQRYRGQKNVMSQLVQKIKTGGSGEWGSAMMTAHPELTDNEIKEMLSYILSLEIVEETGDSPNPVSKKTRLEKDDVNNSKPGFGAPLEGVHPSYDLTTIHDQNFRPRVGGLAFLPDGRLLVATWDGGVYLLDDVDAAETGKINVKRIASGLDEPLGLEVVDGEIFVLQKQELTQLIDLNDDEIIDEYRAICNSWEVSADFHEFAFGLVYKDGYFYATLGMAMRLLAHERQKPDRGRTIKISRDGQYESVNYGLRMPNGIGLGIDSEIFLTDNQGQWLPANKLIHVQKDAFYGMRWGLPDSLSEPPPVTPPAIWLPEDEIGNSPSKPILIPDGPYKGQMLHGDVTHGGIKRDFLEKIKGEYQGAVFRFTQGLEAGVNRLCWGPDDALYIGELGMVGGWSWHGKRYGLQRMEYNGETTFEMLAVRAKPSGFEIEFTEPLKTGQGLLPSEFFLQQWWYLPTASYGGPKMDLETMEATRMKISEDRTRIYLEIPHLKKGHVVYIRLPDDLKSASGQSLWSSEAWYTLNNIPENESNIK